MKYGARNQIKGTVKRIKKDNIMCQVTLDIPEQSVMNSVCTTESLDDLGIQEGDNVRVIVKAINVLLVKE